MRHRPYQSQTLISNKQYCPLIEGKAHGIMGLMSISSWEIWACAAKMMDLHGDNAVLQAAMNADLLLKKGDLDGHQAWLAIMHRIKELEQTAPQASVH